jgi:hypothetical protein
VLIGHPDADWLSTSHAQVLEPCAQRLLKLGGLGRVFSGVSLARHLQDSAQFSQPVVDSFEADAGLMFVFKPGLDFFGPLPLPLSQASQQLLLNRALDPRWRSTAMFTFEQSGHATSLKRIDPIKKLSSAYSQLLRNLCGRHLSASSQSHGQ